MFFCTKVGLILHIKNLIATNSTKHVKKRTRKRFFPLVLFLFNVKTSFLSHFENFNYWFHIPSKIIYILSNKIIY